MAANWIINHNPSNILVDDKRDLEQRCALELLYLSTWGNKWSKCRWNHFNLSDKELCNKLLDLVVVCNKDCIYMDPNKDAYLNCFVEARILLRYHQYEWMGMQCL